MNARPPTRHLSIRNVSPRLARALDEERKRRRVSLNQAVLDLLSRALGLGAEPAPTNGLERHAGGWSDEDLEEFEAATECFEQIDEDLWR